jgi:hypothetical protein
MSAYNPILTESRISASKISSRFTQKVISLLESGSQNAPPLSFEPLDKKSLDEFKKTSADLSKIPQWKHLFVDYLNHDIISTFDIAGGTPIYLPGVGTVFDSSIIGFPIPIPPSPGLEAPWTLSLSSLLGPINPLVTPDIDLLTKITPLGIIIPKVAAPPVENSANIIRTTSFFQETNLDKFCFDISKIPYSIFSKYYLPSLAFVNSSTIQNLHNLIFQDISLLIGGISFLNSISPIPITLRATLNAWADNMSKIITVVIIGATLGAGSICKERATVLGLI